MYNVCSSIQRARLPTYYYSSIMSLINFVILLIILAAEAVSANQQPTPKLCEGIAYSTLGRGDRSRCCEGQLIAPGFSGNWGGLWKIWQNLTIEENDNVTISAWKAYAELLTRIDRSNLRITFASFTIQMVKNYPEQIKQKIGQAALRVLNRTDMMTETKPWMLDAGVLKTDFENLNNIRVTYFRVEQSVCTGKDVDLTADINLWENCSNNVEIYSRDGGCCRNNSIPFMDQLRNSYRSFRCHNCNKTLEKLTQQLGLTEPRDIQLLILGTTCRLSCFLIDNKVITIESLLNGKEPGEFPVDDIVDFLMPVHLSKSVRTYVKDIVKKSFEIAKVKAAIPAKTPLDGKVDTQDLLACYGHDVISLFMDQALRVYCNPETLKKKEATN